MSERFPSPSERRGWHLRAASSPEKPVALGAHSARAMLALLAEGGHIEAHDALAAALAGGNVDAIRVQMDRARVLVPTMSSREQREAELAAAVERVREEACVAAVVERRVAPPPSPAEIRSRLAAALESGVLDDAQRADLERAHDALVAAIEQRRVSDAHVHAQRARALLARVVDAMPECA